MLEATWGHDGWRTPFWGYSALIPTIASTLQNRKRSSFNLKIILLLYFILPYSTTMHTTASTETDLIPMGNNEIGTAACYWHTFYQNPSFITNIYGSRRSIIISNSTVLIHCSLSLWSCSWILYSSSSCWSLQILTWSSFCSWSLQILIWSLFCSCSPLLILIWRSFCSCWSLPILIYSSSSCWFLQILIWSSFCSCWSLLISTWSSFDFWTLPWTIHVDLVLVMARLQNWEPRQVI